MKAKIPKFHIIIPARYHSSRLPGKVLKDIGGKSMLQRVYEQAKASAAVSIMIATEDQRVVDAATAMGAPVCLTSSEHESGTERLAEVIARSAYDKNDIIVAVQGDEPFIAPANINQVAEALASHPEASMATLYEETFSFSNFIDKDYVKVVTDANGYALYFSRMPIPWDRNQFDGPQQQIMMTAPCKIHVGLYAYRAEFVVEYNSLPQTSIEVLESLEQLRALYYGKKILVVQAGVHCHAGVNTLEDLQAARDFVASN